MLHHAVAGTPGSCWIAVHAVGALGPFDSVVATVAPAGEVPSPPVVGKEVEVILGDALGRSGPRVRPGS